ncbi:MBL fold metallo-hydrolase [Larkinella bovis]|uniref:MBL fold metallo-hydrolase n=1 Tax=Larkinella bovis TaxID=683041 RepID=A0ABW0IG60_9BACT
MNTTLQWDTLFAKRPGLNRDLPAGHENLMWVSNTATLIYGDQDAVLVDTFLTVEHNQMLVNWIAAHNRNLKAVYITHGHGDHFFGLDIIRERYPDVQFLATPKVVSAIAHHIAAAHTSQFWQKLYPGQISENLLTPEPMSEPVLYLEGNALRAIDAGPTDTADTTCLWVPSIGLLVGGDVIYNGVHPYLAETTKQTRNEWRHTLQQLASLQPAVVIAGHKNPTLPDDPRCVNQTLEYLETIETLSRETASAEALFDQMMLRYPDYVNPGSLWRAVHTIKSETADQ